LQFFVIGPQTDYIIELQQQARKEDGSENLHFIDYTADPREAIRRVNVVLSFSLFAESFGRSIAEAMAARRPVIVYRSGALPELVRHNRDGFLIPRLDYAKALDHLEFLVSNPDRLLEMGRSSRERVKQMFSTGRFKQELNGIYQQILTNWRPEVATAECST
jgi:glycosyltransferase involved in cell wall biosynthesis